MTKFRCVIVGVSGGRANGHAAAFAHMPRGELVAVSTRTQANLDRFADQWNVTARFTDYDRMFRDMQPDVVFVNTPPHVRLEVLQSAEAHGVRGLIVEKPLAMQAEDYQDLCTFAQSARLRVAINHQLHFHPRRRHLQALVRAGAIGTIQTIRASARMNMAYQGTHVLQALQAFQPSPPQEVYTTLMAGIQGLQPTPRMHMAPDECAARIVFADGSHGFLQCGPNAPLNDPNDTRSSHHKQVTVIGTEGSVHWSMTSWATVIQEQTANGQHIYHEEDILGQAHMTEAMFDWIEDDDKVHPLHLEAALRDFRVLLTIYTSGLSGQPENLLKPPPQHLLDTLRNRLAQA